MPIAPVITPVQVNASGEIDNVAHTINAPGGSAGASAAIRTATGLWTSLQRVTDHKYVMYRSTDNLTWHEVDGANGPRYGGSTGAGIAWNGAILTVCCVDGSNQAQLCDFNTLTGFWGAPYGNAGATVVTSHFYQAFRQLSGLLTVFFFEDASSQMKVTRTAGFGAWDAPVAVSTNLPVGYDLILQAAVTKDTADIYYLVVPIKNTGSGIFDAILVQAIAPDLTLGLFIALSNTNQGQWFYPNPAVDLGTGLYVGVNLSTGGNPAILTCVDRTALDVVGNWSISAAIDTFTGQVPTVLFLPSYNSLAALYVNFATPNFARLGFQQPDGSWKWIGLQPIASVAFFNVAAMNLTTGPGDEMALIMGTDFGPAIIGAVLTPVAFGGPPIEFSTVNASALVSIGLPDPKVVCCKPYRS